jgi:MFS transporter, CP family, cyanate transporter
LETQIEGSSRPRHVAQGTIWQAVALVLVGGNLRTIMLEVPPILPQIQHDLGLNYTVTGLLNSMPQLLLGVCAIPAALVIARIGARNSLVIALAAITFTSLFRSIAGNIIELFAATVLMSVAIALGQTSIPSIIQQHFNNAIAQVTAAYSTGLMIGEIAAASLTIPVVLPYFSGGSWRGTFIFWGILVGITLVIWLLVMREDSATREAGDSLVDDHLLFIDIFRNGQVWRAAIVLGCGSLLFFGLDTWIPVYFHALHRSDGPLNLTVLTIAQLPPSLLLTFFGNRLIGRRGSFIITGGLASIAMLLWFIVPPQFLVILSGIIGATSATGFIMGLSLPSFLFEGRGIAQISGMMLGIGYTLAFVGPFIGGLFWDITKWPVSSFIPIFVAALVITVLGATLPGISAHNQPPEVAY